MRDDSQKDTTSGQNRQKETQASEPITTTSQLVNKYADVLDDIVSFRTHGSYTFHGVLGCFLNEWLEMRSPDDEEKDWDTQEEIYTALQKSMDREIEYGVFYGTNEKEDK